MWLHKYWRTGIRRCERFSEHCDDVINRRIHNRVAKHFNSTGDSASDMSISVLILVNNILKMRILKSNLIKRLRTLSKWNEFGKWLPLCGIMRLYTCYKKNIVCIFLFVCVIKYNADIVSDTSLHFARAHWGQAHWRGFIGGRWKDTTSDILWTISEPVSFKATQHGSYGRLAARAQNT